MTDSMIIEAVALIGGLIAIVVPIVRLNSNIVKLTAAVDSLDALVKKETERLDKRITAHGNEIDELKASRADHEARIKILEK